MNISRNHAQIVYNFERGALRAHCSCVLRLPTVVQAVFGDTGSWEMVVMGKNGVTVQGTLYAPVDGQPMSGIQLHSQDYIQIGDRGFYFLLPRSQARHAQSVGALASGGLATGVSRRTELDFGVCRPGVAFGGWPASGSKQPRCVPFHTDTLVVCYGDHPYRWCNIHGACQTWRARGGRTNGMAEPALEARFTPPAAAHAPAPASAAGTQAYQAAPSAPAAGARVTAADAPSAHDAANGQLGQGAKEDAAEEDYDMGQDYDEY